MEKLKRGAKAKLLERSEARKAQDLMIRHQVYLGRLAETYANELLAIIDSADRETADYLLKRLARFGEVSPGVRTEAKFKQVERGLREIREAAFDEAEAQLAMKAIELGDYESSFAARSLRESAEGAIAQAIPEKVVESIANYGSFAGHPIKSWFEGLAQQDMRNVMASVRQGVVQGTPTEQIVRRIRGTAAANYQDGILTATRRSVRTIVRTVTNGMANDVRMRTYEENADVIDHLQFLATLDSKTSPICRALDGRKWDIGDPNIKQPPLHPNCRSVIVAVAKGFGLLGKRPAKDENGNVEQVPAATTYSEWFADQSEEFQKDILGPTRFELYKKGDLPIDRFVDYNSNKQFTLTDLSKREPEAFKDADVEPVKLEQRYGKIVDTSDPKNTSVYLTAEDGIGFPKNEPEMEPLRDIFNAARKSPAAAENYLRETAQSQGVEYGVVYDKDGNWYSVAKGGPTAVHMQIPRGARKVSHNHPNNLPLSCADACGAIDTGAWETEALVDGGRYVLTRTGEDVIITAKELKDSIDSILASREVGVDEFVNIMQGHLHGKGFVYEFRRD